MKRLERRKIILLCGLAFFVLILFRGELSNLFKTDFNSDGYYYSRQFDSEEMRWVNTNNLSKIGASLVGNPEGAVYNFKKKYNDRVYAKFIFGMPYDSISNAYKNLRCIELFSGNRFIKKLDYSNLNIGSTTFTLTSPLRGNTDYSIYLKRLPLNQGRFNDLAVRRIEVTVLPKKFLPNLPMILTSMLIPIVIFNIFNTLGIHFFKNSVYTSLILAMFSILLYFNYNFIANSHLFILSVVYLLYILIVRITKMPKNYIYSFLLAILIIVGINLRWAEIERVAFALAHPDAGHPFDGFGYRELADNMKLFTKDGFFAVKAGLNHEPFYPFVVKIFFIIFKSSDLHIRYVSFFFSILAIFLTYLAGKEAFNNRGLGLISAGIIAINSYLIEQASFGLRLELETCFLLAIFYYCYLRRGVLKTYVWFIVSGILGGLWLLTRSHTLPVILFIFGYSAFTRKDWKLIKKTALFILLSIFSISFLIPYKTNLYKKYGSSFKDTSVYTTSLANIEFAGQQGFPRLNVSLPDYFFKLHSPGQLFIYHISGYAVTFYCLTEEIFNAINEANHLGKVFLKDKFLGVKEYPILTLKVITIFLLSILSIILCWIKRNLRIIIYIIAFGTLPSAFIYGLIVKRMTVLEYHRPIAQVLPFMALCLVYTLNAIILFLFQPLNFSKKQI